MSVAIPEDIKGLDEASAELDRLFAAEGLTSESGQPQESAQPAAEAAGGQRAAQAGEAAAQDPSPSPEKKVEGQKPETGKPEVKTEPKPGESLQTAKGPEKSRYQKAVERQEKSWQELNAQKEALKAERAALEQSTKQLEEQRQAFEARRTEAEREFSPEAYDDAAKKFEASGKFELAELAKAKAAELRKNPPSGGAKAPGGAAAAQQAQNEAASREWALKAGQEFPDLVKANSPLQVRVAQILQSEPDLKAHPKGIYLAARLASLEAASAGVAERDKELGQLRARVKELEQATAPNGSGAAQTIPAERSFEQKSDAEQYEELQQLAQSVGSLR